MTAVDPDQPQNSANTGVQAKPSGLPKSNIGGSTGAGLEWIKVLIQCAGVVTVAVGLWFTNENLRLSRETQLGDRYVTAVQLLADPRMESRIAGIHAIASVASESERHHIVIMELLADWLSGRCPLADSSEARSRGMDRDVSTAVRVISRRNVAHDDKTRPILLSDLDLRNLALVGGSLRGVSLVKSDLRHSFLSSVDLEQANLTLARIDSPIVWECNLRQTMLLGTWCRNTSFLGSDFTKTIIYGAWFDDAEFTAPTRESIGRDWKMGTPAFITESEESMLAEYRKLGDATNLSRLQIENAASTRGARLPSYVSRGDAVVSP